jgi:hypothetical protein
MPPPPRSALWIVLSILAGCVRVEPQPLLPSETVSVFESRTFDNPDLLRFLESNLQREVRPWPLRPWDIDLLTLAAFYYHPDLDVARARWAVAEAGVITAGQRPNPSVGFSPIYVSNAAQAPLPWLFGLTFDIPIETAGKRGYRIVQARQLSTAAQFNIAVVAWQVRSRVRTSLLNLLAAERAVVIVQRRLALDEPIVKLVEQRLTFGEISQPEVTQAHIALNQDRSPWRTCKSKRSRPVQLAAAIGLPVNALTGGDYLRFPEQSPSVKFFSEGEVRGADQSPRSASSALADYDAAQTA